MLTTSPKQHLTKLKTQALAGDGASRLHLEADRSSHVCKGAVACVCSPRVCPLAMHTMGATPRAFMANMCVCVSYRASLWHGCAEFCPPLHTGELTWG